MDLSVIIISYNVKHFLEHCLLSVSRAIEGLNAEVIVVDNNSSDGTGTFIPERVPYVKFIRNTENVGYSKANNQGLAYATGEYILFLNPDTIVAEDSFQKCVEFMVANPQAGALGVRMIDGSGKFLPESKRGYPGAWNSFAKMTGLARMFPSSRLLSGYYLGHLREDKEHVVDVLSGAYLFARRSALAQTGGFDERFFMFGEDIDLSVRIQNIGLVNYYIPYTTIVHFKGESTSRDRTYLKNFYGAMLIFVDKHYSGLSGSIKGFLLKSAIQIRLLIASLKSTTVQIPPSSRKSYQFIGDALCAGRANAQLQGSYEPGKSDDSTECPVLCVGPDFTYKTMILHMDGNPGLEYHICSLQSNSIISSSSSLQQGIAIELERDLS